MPADSNRQLQTLVWTLKSDPQLVRKVLQEAYPSAAGLFLIPSGGEAHGYLTVTSVSAEEVGDAASALLALWKIDHCLGGEEAYEPWDSEALDWFLEKPFQQSLSTWLDSVVQRSDAEKWIEWMRGGAKEVIRAQFEEVAPRNHPEYLPDKAAADAAGLLKLDYLSLGVPYWILCDAWNDVEGLFRFRGRWFFVEWGTNA